MRFYLGILTGVMLAYLYLAFIGSASVPLWVYFDTEHALGLGSRAFEYLEGWKSSSYWSYP